MRLWLSGPRILHGLVRPGISLGREDWSPPLPLRHGLQEAAKARGETITKEERITASIKPWRPAYSIPTAT